MNNYILKNANVYDGTLNMKLIPLTNVEITNGIITNIGEFNLKKGYKVIDLNGKYVIPGLINLHSHLPSSGKIKKKKLGDMGKLVNFVKNTHIGHVIGNILVTGNAKSSLRSGVTTIRTVGGVGTFDSELRDKINKGKVLGPRLIVCNEGIGTEGGHMVGTVAVAVRSIEEIKKEVTRLYNEHVDLIKLMITGGVLDGNEEGKPARLRMPIEYVKACTGEAHKLGLKVCAHVESKEGMHVAITGGVDSIEHGSLMDKSDLLEFKKRNGVVVTTLSAALPFLALSPEDTGYGKIAQVNSKIVFDGMVACAKECLDNGIMVGLGTDSGSTLSMHYNFYKELIYYVKYLGIDSNFALHSATEVNAIIAGVDKETGTVSVGKSADLLVVEKDPIKDLNVLEKPSIIFMRGIKVTGKSKHYKKADLLISKMSRCVK